MRGFRTVYGVPYYYLDEKLEFRRDFYICTEDEKYVISEEFRLPGAFTKDMVERGIEHANKSLHNKLQHNSMHVKRKLKEYCERRGMNLILMSYPDIEVENEIVKYHMRRFYRMDIGFDPLADFRRLKAMLRPSP